MPSNEVWVVGRWPGNVGGRWHFQGVFLTEQEAIDAAIDATYFVAPVTMGEILPHDRVSWPGLFYPLGS